MATIIESTIGTGGTYTTLADWYASIPSNLVTADQVHRGKVLNQELVMTTTLTISGKTTDATRYIELTTDTGASFMDHANKATNPLRYNASVGAAIRSSGAGGTINVQQSYTRISNLQISNTNTGSTAQPAFFTNGAGTTVRVSNLIVEGSGINTAVKGVFRVTLTGSIVSNCVAIQLKNDVLAMIGGVANGVQVSNCTFVSLGTTVNVGFQTANAASVWKNVYVGGATAPEDGTVASTKTNCYSSVAATGYSVAALSTATFENVTSGSQDLRLKSGSSLINAGTTDATNAPADIIGTARPQGAAYDVGAWEFAGSATPVDGTLTWTEADDISAITAAITVEGVSGTITYTEDDDVCSIAANVAVGTITSGVFKNNTGSILASLTGLTVTVLNASTLAFVKNFTSRTTNGSGVMILQDSLLVIGTEYAVVTTNVTGTLGVEKYTAT